MRFWHPELLHLISGSSLSALHLNLCRIRQNPWGKPKPSTWYYNLSWGCLTWYHSLVMREMAIRNWNPSVKWLDNSYRGKLPPADYDGDCSSRLEEFERINLEPLSKQRLVLSIPVTTDA